MPQVTRIYPLKFEPGDNDTILVTCPDLPDLVAFGNDEADALCRAADAIRGVAKFRLDRGLRMPLPRRPSRGQPVTGVKLEIS